MQQTNGLSFAGINSDPPLLLEAELPRDDGAFDIQQQDEPDHVSINLQPEPMPLGQNAHEDVAIDAEMNSLPAFLRNMMPPLPLFGAADGAMHNPLSRSGFMTPRGLMDFGFETNLELSDIDLSFLDDYNLNVPFDFQTPITIAQSDQTDSRSPEEEAALRAEIFKSSVWRFKPRREDNATEVERHLSSLHPDGSPGTAEPHIKLDRRSTIDRLQHGSRDKILALVLRTIDTSNVPRIVEAFPSVELLDNLLQYYLTSPFARARTWLHIPTMSPITNTGPELLTAMIAAGAVLTPDAALRKLGLAFQEALRRFIPLRWEADNSKTRDLELLQAYILHLEIGLWSGNSRVMEMAESFLQPIVTMMRRAGKFRHSNYAVSEICSDMTKPVSERWKVWAEQESWIRLVFYVFQHDAKVSIAFLANPIVSYAEIALPLPENRSLWDASDAATWAQLWQARSNQTRRLSLIDCLNDVNILNSREDAFDLERASFAYLYAQWGLVWEHRQLSSASRSHSHQRLLLNSRLQELIKTLDQFRLCYDGGKPDSTGRLLLTLEMLHLHLHMSLEDVQLFAGIEGHEEAVRVLPALQEWIRTPAARQAMWHAGQIVRLAREFPRGMLREIFAISVYHASLAFWVYGLVRQNNSHNYDQGMYQNDSAIVWLDGAETTNVQRFLSLDRGIPAISRRDSSNKITVAAIDDPAAVLSATLNVLQANHEKSAGAKPLLVANLVQLIGGLRTAVKASHGMGQSS